MKIKGKIKIEWRDLRTGELLRSHQQKNLIPNNTLVDILDWRTNHRFYNTRISISEQSTPPLITNPTLTQITGTGYIPGGITSPMYYPNSVPPYAEIFNRIDPVGIPRTFETVGLTALPAANSQANLTSTAYAYLLLSIPCTQGQFEFLNIYYRLEFSGNPGEGLNSQSYIDFGKALITSPFDINSSFRVANLCTGYAKKPTKNYSALAVVNNNNNNISIDNFGSGVKIASHYKWKMILSQGYSFAVGRVFSAMIIGISEDENMGYGAQKFNGKPTPIQNAFTKSAIATKPFFDSSELGSGTGYEILSEIVVNGWQSKFPEFYQFQIGTGGAVGTATYKFRKRNFLQFNGNTYADQVINCPFRNTNTIPNLGFHGWKIENNDLIKFSNTQIVQYDDTGVTLLDLITGDYTHYDSTTTPALPVTQSRQVATNGSKIWVGCRNTGLWEIDVAANTIGYLVASPCYGVDAGNGKTWALFDGGLRNSDNWAIAVTFAYAGISDANWNKVKFLKADPSHADHRLALITDNALGTARTVVWWDSTLVLGTAIAGYSSAEIKAYPASLDVSDTIGFWATNGLKLDYGSATTLLLTSCATQSFTHSIYGVDNYYKISFYKDFLICSDRIVDPANTAQNIYENLGVTASVVHLAGGIILGSNFIKQLFTDNSYAWENYGWDGTNWTAASASYKATHADDRALINGLQVKWVNGASAPYFVAGETINQGVCYGLLKDTASTIYYEAAWYSKSVHFDASLTSQVIPASPPYALFCQPFVSDPDFLMMETDSPALQQFTINGNAITTLYVNGEIPGVNEITLDGTIGRVVFNAADAGKTFAGKGCYIAD